MKACIICGKNLPAHRFRQNCCSDECRREKAKLLKRASRASKRAKDRAENQKLQARPCIVCGENFVPYSSSAKICSKACIRQREKERRSMRDLVNHKCVICGQEFSRASDSIRTTCSQACGSELRVIRARETSTVKYENRTTAPMRENFCAMETGCQEFRSWNCPEMLPLEWVDIPTAVRVNIRTIKKMEVAA